jgi:hypothetical protein
MASLIKLKDNAFDGEHPNRVFEGHRVEIEGMGEAVIIGESFRFGSLTTSRVTKLLRATKDYTIFETWNSTYIIEYLK